MLSWLSKDRRECRARKPISLPTPLVSLKATGHQIIMNL